jgi:RNA polymerase sigma factor (sigma-70 family)
MSRTQDDYVCEILRMEKALRAILHRFAPQPADLEDLLQETYSRLFSLGPERRLAINNVQAFAVTTARHIATDWLRHNKVVSIETVEDLEELDVYVSGGSDLEEIVHTHQQLLVLSRGLSSLPDRSREVFTLRRVYGLTQKEIAAKLGISEGAVEQLLIRSMRHCAKVLGSSDEQLTNARTRNGWLKRWRKRLRKGRQG